MDRLLHREAVSETEGVASAGKLKCPAAWDIMLKASRRFGTEPPL
jgi:hypothetical protein